MRCLLLLLALTLSACVTPRAQQRLEAEWQLRRCLRLASYHLPFQLVCYQRAQEDCFRRGLEKDCASDWVSVRS